MTAQDPKARQEVDLLVTGASIVTLNDRREIITDGALAVRDGRFVAVGKTAEVQAAVAAAEVIDGSRFVVTPGYVNGHVHITGEPLTKGLVPDDAGFAENVFQWLVPIHMAYGEEDERVSSQYAALEMLKSGTTCFLEAGTINFLDAAIDGVTATGIRARLGQWAWDYDPATDSHPASETDRAIAVLEDELARYSPGADARVAAWPILIGHMTCSGPLWAAAKALADRAGAGVAAHMSPHPSDPDWFLAKHGARPAEFLARHGALGPNVSLTHFVHADAREVAILAETGANVCHCATSALKGAYGATAVGRFAEMAAKGVNLFLGTDGNNNANTHDLMRASYLLAGLFRDHHQDPSLFPAEAALEAAITNGARALGLSEAIGSIAVGKRADFVFHDTNRVEWRPLFNIVNQLVYSADGRGVHSVWVDGRRVIADYRSTLIDEDALLAEVQARGEAIVARSGLPIKSRWPVL